jgi:hypothetical protein
MSLLLPLSTTHRRHTDFISSEVIEVKVVAAGPVSRIRRTALQTDKLFEISLCEVSMMSTLAVMAGFASHWRHNRRFETIVCT